MAEDRKLFAVMLDKLGLRQTPTAPLSAWNKRFAIAIALAIQFSLGHRSSSVAAAWSGYNEMILRRYVAAAIDLGRARVPRAVIGHSVRYIGGSSAECGAKRQDCARCPLPS